MKKNIISIVVIFATVLLFYKDVIIYKKLPIPSDSISALYHPYKDFFAKDYPRGYPFKNFLITDPLRQQYPWKEIAVSSLKQGRIPLWNPYNGAGEPLFANIQSGVLYPLNILFFILPFHIGWAIFLFLQPFLAGIFTYLYLSNLNLSKRSSLIGSIAFAFSGFNVTWFEWGNIVHTGLWLPLVLLSIDKIFSIKISFKPPFQKKLLIWGLVFIFSLSSSLLAGHLQTFFYLALFCCAYFFARWWQSKRPKNTLLFMGILVSIFAVITSTQWISTFQFISNSARSTDQIWTKDGWFIPFAHFIQFVVPDFFGNPSTLNYWGTWNYGELTGYIGIIPIVFSLVALFVRKDKKTLFFALLLLIAILFSSENIIAKIPFILNIPFISTAQPTRLLFIIDFCMSVLAGLGFDYYIKNKKSILVPIGVVGVLLTFFWALPFLRFVDLNVSAENLAVVKRNLILPSVFFLCLIFLSSSIHIFKKNKIFTQFFLLTFIFLTIIDLLRFSSKFNTFTDEKLLFPKTKVTEFLSDQSAEYPWRFLGVDYVENQKRILPPNLSSHDRLYTLDTYNPLLLKRYQEFAAISEWGFTDIPDFSFNRSIILNNYDSKLIDFMGVKYIVAINEIESKKLEFIFREGDTRVYENKNALDRAFMVYDYEVLKDNRAIARKIYSSETNLSKKAIIEKDLSIEKIKDREVENKVRILKYTENLIELEIETEKDGLLVLTDTFYPTWSVRVDDHDQEIYRTNYSFRSVLVRAGEHRVVFMNSLY